MHYESTSPCYKQLFDVRNNLLAVHGGFFSKKSKSKTRKLAKYGLNQRKSFEDRSLRKSFSAISVHKSTSEDGRSSD